MDNEQGLIVERTIALRPYPAVTLFRDAMYASLKDKPPPDVWMSKHSRFATKTGGASKCERACADEWLSHQDALPAKLPAHTHTELATAYV